MDFESILRGVAAIGYLGTFLVIASYRPGSAHWRPGVSVFAAALAGGSFALAILTATGVLQQVVGGALWALCVQCLCVFGLVIRCRGNLAKLLPSLRPRRLT